MIEKDRHSPHIYIFDVDGPISDPADRKISDSKIIDELVAILEKGDVVALNTGRSAEWLHKGPQDSEGKYPDGQKGLIALLDERVTDTSLFQRFYGIGEKGGAEIRCEQGEWKTTVDPAITVPRELQDTIRSLITNEYSEWMFNDITKRTMITSEMNPMPRGASAGEIEKRLLQYHQAQERLAIQLKGLLEERNVQNEYKVDSNAIATDIEAKGAGKDLGVLRIYTWLTEELNLDPLLLDVDTIGDSSSDIPMAEALKDKVKSVRFVFVGDAEKQSNKDALAKVTVPLIITENKNGAGTIEFLESELHKNALNVQNE